MVVKASCFPAVFSFWLLRGRTQELCWLPEECHQHHPLYDSRQRGSLEEVKCLHMDKGFLAGENWSGLLKCERGVCRLWSCSLCVSHLHQFSIRRGVRNREAHSSMPLPNSYFCTDVVSMHQWNVLGCLKDAFTLFQAGLYQIPGFFLTHSFHFFFNFGFVNFFLQWTFRSVRHFNSQIWRWNSPSFSAHPGNDCGEWLQAIFSWCYFSHGAISVCFTADSHSLSRPICQ